MRTISSKNKCFVVWSNDIDGRLDSYYYKPEFQNIIKELKNSKVKLKTIGEISTLVRSGFTPEAKLNAFTESKEILFIRNTDLKPYEIRFDNTKRIKRELKDIFKNTLLKKNDVLLSMAGTIGTTALYDREELATINQNITLIRFKEEINPLYAIIWMNTKYFQKLIDRIATIATIKYVNNELIKKLPMPLPKKEIQNKIINLIEVSHKKKRQKEQEANGLLNSIDDYISDKLSIEMPEMKDKKCFSVNADEMVNNRLDSHYYQPKFKEIEKVLKGGKYKIEPLKNYITKIHYGASIKNIYVDEGIPLLRIINLKPNKIDLREVVKVPESKRKEIGNAFVNKGDILISRSGSVGIVAVVPKEADSFAFGSFMIKFCVNNKINKDYVSIWLNNRIAQLFTQREKIGAIQGNITISTIESFKIPAPSLEIQNKIVSEVKKRVATAEKLKLETRNVVENAKKEVEKIILGK